MGYTASQQTFISNADGFNLVVALPGSGKSHSAIGACRQILETDPSYTVLMVTFTRAATNEMKERLNKALGTKMAQRVRVETFHSLFLEQYKQLNPKVRLAIGNVQRNFALRAKNKMDDSLSDSEALEMIEICGRSMHYDMSSNGVALYNYYVELLERYGYVDFNMIARQVWLAMEQERIEPYPFTHAIVDEFQDCDDIQYEWMRCHGDNGTKISCVGDDDQSIYGFRGSNGYNVLVDFQKHYHAMGHQLTECFRCAPKILSAAELFIQANEQRIPKVMNSMVSDAGRISEVKCPNAIAQANLIVETAMPALSKWAVLARTNKHLDAIESVFSTFGVKVKRLGGKSIWDHSSADMALKILYSLCNQRNHYFLHEILAFLGECEDVLHAICQQAQHSGGFSGVMEDPDEHWLTRTHKLREQWCLWLSDEQDAHLIAHRLRSLCDIVENINLKPDNVFASIMDMVNGMKGSLFERVTKLTARLFTIASVQDEECDTVTLATMHGSKGLEWEHVWITDVNSDTVPNKRSCVEEERRLFYVAMTRAKTRLSMSYVKAKSPFLNAINENSGADIEYIEIEETEKTNYKVLKDAC